MRADYSSYFVITYKTTKLHDRREKRKEKRKKNKKRKEQFLTKYQILYSYNNFSSYPHPLYKDLFSFSLLSLFVLVESS